MDGGAAEEFADSQAGALRDLGTSGPRGWGRSCPTAVPRPSVRSLSGWRCSECSVLSHLCLGTRHLTDEETELGVDETWLESQSPPQVELGFTAPLMVALAGPRWGFSPR